MLNLLLVYFVVWPFPVSYQKGWKIHNFIHGHRIFFIAELDHCLLTVVTWSSSHTGLVIPADEAPSVLLSSLNEYIQLRRLQMTPLLQISLPHHVVVNDKPTTPNPFVKPASSPPSKPSEGGLFSRFRQFVDQYSSSGKGSGSDAGSKAAIPESIRRSSSILRYRSSGNAGGLLARSGLAGDNSHAIKEEEEVESDFDSDEFAEMGQPSDDDDLKDQGAGDTSGAKVAKAIARYQTMINQAAAELLAEMLPSGWIIESVRKDNRLYSLVTYLMQVD
nr:hypothetical protein BaRGS_012304 [Batillaria attramentaria]